MRHLCPMYSLGVLIMQLRGCSLSVRLQCSEVHVASSKTAELYDCEAISL